jgi:hypothetical protein
LLHSIQTSPKRKEEKTSTDEIMKVDEISVGMMTTAKWMMDDATVMRLFDEALGLSGERATRCEQC